MIVDAAGGPDALARARRTGAPVVALVTGSAVRTGTDGIAALVPKPVKTRGLLAALTSAATPSPSADRAAEGGGR